MSLQHLFKGFSRQWFYDLGCATFLGTGLMGLVMAFAMSFAPRVEPLTILTGLTIISTAIACAWQLNRISAIEGAHIIPHYINRILGQCTLVFISAIGLSYLVLLNAEYTDLFGLLGIIASWGMAFVYVCIKWPRAFFLSIIAYLIMPWLPDLYAVMSMSLWLKSIISWALVPIFGALILRHYQQPAWHVEARSVYLNGLEMGFYWFPQVNGGRLSNWLERQLHPMSFFIGPMLTVLILILPCLVLVMDVVTQTMGIDLPIHFILLQCVIVSCSLVHWSRIQRWRSVELLLVMPGYSGRSGMRDAFYMAQNRFITLITLGVALVTLGILLMRGDFHLVIWLHISLAAYWSSAFMLGIGSACKTALHISSTIILVIILSAWIMGTLAMFGDGQFSYWWLGTDLIACVFAYGALIWGKRKLWQRDILA